jgi:hypothetical protein
MYRAIHLTVDTRHVFCAGEIKDRQPQLILYSDLLYPGNSETLQFPTFVPADVARLS